MVGESTAKTLYDTRLGSEMNRILEHIKFRDFYSLHKSMLCPSVDFNENGSFIIQEGFLCETS